MVLYSPLTLVEILQRLAPDWATCKSEYEQQYVDLYRLADATADDDESFWSNIFAEQRESDYFDHPFPRFVRLVSDELCIFQAKLRSAALRDFDGESQLVAELNALDEKGSTAAHFEKLREEYPGIANRLFGPTLMMTSDGNSSSTFVKSEEAQRATPELADSTKQVVPSESQTDGQAAESATSVLQRWQHAVSGCIDGPHEDTETSMHSSGPQITDDAKINLPDRPAGFLGVSDLARALEVHSSRKLAFQKQLERSRIKLGDRCWHQVRESRPNEPQYLYRVDDPSLRKLATGYTEPKLA